MRNICDYSLFSDEKENNFVDYDEISEINKFCIMFIFQY